MDTPNQYTPSAEPVQTRPWQPPSMYNSYPSNTSMGNGQSGWGNGMPVGIPPGSQNGSMGQLNAMNNMHMMMPQFSMGGMMPNLMMPPAKPIGSEEDDSLLVKALKEADATGKTYRQALDALHMQSGHSAMAWKDYYLDHATRLNDLVMKKSTKKPVFAESNHVSSGPVKSLSSVQPKSAAPYASKPSRPEPRPKPRLSHPSPPHKQIPRRSTDNLPAFGSSLRLASRASQKNVSSSSRNDVSLPPVPSYPPTPPTKVVQGTNGNKFTAEDKQFFIDHLMWELNRNPSLSKSQLCASLAEKAGHHSYASWGSYWTHNPHPADEILHHFHELDSAEDGAEGESSSEESDDESSENASPPPVMLKREIPKRLPPAVKRVRDEVDQEQMGQGGGPITKADKRAVAKFIACYDDWDSVKPGPRWKMFNEKFPQRSSASWAEMYRRYKDEINGMIPKYRQAFDSRTGDKAAYVDVDALEDLPQPKRVKSEPMD